MTLHASISPPGKAANKQRWVERAAAGGIVPVVRECILDADQPVAVLAKIARGPFAFLLESAVGGERWARYTFLGTEPREAWRYRGGNVERWTPEGGWAAAGSTADPIGHLGDRMRSLGAAPEPDLPRFFGGAIGFFGYDVVRTLERLPGGAAADEGLPDALFVVADTVLILDNLYGRARIVVNVEVPRGASLRARETAFDRAEARIADWMSRLDAPGTLGVLALDDGLPPAEGASPYPDEQFLRDVERVKAYIAAGDIFQGVLSRRVDVACAVDPLLLYRYLRALNPAPYLYYLALDELAIVGSSPEVLVRVEERDVTLRPIAGTRPRGSTPLEDEALAAELAADPKERAEHLMLVDLGRNDVGRVAEFGSVRLHELMTIERYAHVQHLVSEVRGVLPAGKDAVDVLKACFPAGTVTGAPKVRAMEIIDGLEPTRRGPYAGAVGYIGWGARNLDTAIAIRTCVVQRDRVLVQAGAGIVADSVPERELAETEAKARGALQAVALACREPVRRR
ncbi:MAG: anthranilate synthase component I family protein [Gemmatimonadales bacterium]|nr:anthranilate synthase component I family protein [Gemmatimonadales bacterium]